jgi:hypothetical protein
MYISSTKLPFKKAVPISNYYNFMLRAAVIVRIARIDSCQMIGEYVSKKSTPCLWTKLLTMKQALFFSIGPLA